MAVGLRILGNSHGLKKYQHGYHTNPTKPNNRWDLEFVGVCWGGANTETERQRMSVDEGGSKCVFGTFFKILLHCSLLSALRSCGGDVATAYAVQFHFLTLTWKCPALHHKAAGTPSPYLCRWRKGSGELSRDCSCAKRLIQLS